MSLTEDKSSDAPKKERERIKEKQRFEIPIARAGGIGTSLAYTKRNEGTRKMAKRGRRETRAQA